MVNKEGAAFVLTSACRSSTSRPRGASTALAKSPPSSALHECCVQCPGAAPLCLCHPTALCSVVTRRPSHPPLQGSQPNTREELDLPKGIEPDGLYVFGRNNRGQLGLGHTEAAVGRVTRLPFFTTAHQVWVAHRLITFGASYFPQPLAIHRPHPDQVRKVFCAYDHTFVLTARDEVFSFGRNSKGQLGVGNTVDQASPQKVHLLSGKKVSCLIALGHSRPPLGASARKSMRASTLTPQPDHSPRIILQSRSPKLYQTALASSPTHADAVQIRGVPLAAFRTLLEFIYTGK